MEYINEVWERWVKVKRGSKYYWINARSDMSNPMYCTYIAENMVKSVFDANEVERKKPYLVWKPQDRQTKRGIRIEVKATSRYLPSWADEFYTKMLFQLARPKWYNIDGSDATEMQFGESSNVFVFCVYNGETEEMSPLNCDLWEFYVLPSRVMRKLDPNKKSIRLGTLLAMNAIPCDYYGIEKTIRKFVK